MGATNQKFMNMIFKDKIGSTVEVYINDIVKYSSNLLIGPSRYL